MLIQLTNEDTVSKDKNDSELSKLDFQLSEQAVSKIEELNIMFEKQQSLHGKRKALIRKLLETLREDGFKDHQIVDIVLDRVKGVSRSTIYAALPQEVKRQYTKPLPKTINVQTEHKVIDVPEQTQEEALTEEEDFKKWEQNKKELEQMAAPEEDPKDLEISFLKEKVSELQEALKKTQQFVPATQIQEEEQERPAGIVFSDETLVFEWLRKRENGINTFYYDNYGINLVPSRLLAQLKNSGVKVFRRLYFEV